MPLTLLIPITRPWTLDVVSEAVEASDIPRERCVLVFDAAGCEGWIQRFGTMGFAVEAYATGQATPPTDRYERRVSHNAMRAFTLPLVGDGAVLALDDDTVVPRDVYTRLTAAGPHATGVQISRWGSPLCGVYRDGQALAYRDGGVESIDYCGHYCLLTDGATYRATALHGPHECYMKPIAGLKVDWGCVCGHLTKEGVLWPTHQN